MALTTMSASGAATRTFQVSANALGALRMMGESSNSALMPLLLGGATTLRARMDDTQPHNASAHQATQTVRKLLMWRLKRCVAESGVNRTTSAPACPASC